MNYETIKSVMITGANAGRCGPTLIKIAKEETYECRLENDRKVANTPLPSLRVRSGNFQKPTEGHIRISSIPSGWATVRGPTP
jgi:hypothetical protein